MDYTIEVWTFENTHFALCTCGWQRFSAYQPVLESFVKNHKTAHQASGDFVEIV